MKEETIRPKALIRKYFDLCKKDVEIFFNNNKLIEINCVACNSKLKIHNFVKHKFHYSTCKKCGTLYNNLRPELKKFELFYKNSKSSKYWAKSFLPKVSKTRIKKVFRPNAAKIIEFFKNQNIENPKKIIDVGAGQGLFLDELKKKIPLSSFIAIEPSSDFAKICIKKGYKTYVDILENAKVLNEDKADLVISSEVIEHVFSPYDYLKKIKSITKKKGIIIFTTLTNDGIDLSLLNKQSTQILPPHHINFISIRGFHLLSKRLKLKLLDIKTPGKMDIDILKNNMHLIESKNHKLFLNFIYQNKLEKKFQNFIQSNKRSSHIWVYLRNE